MPVDGEYRIRITEELSEVAYIDQLQADRSGSSGGHGRLHQRQIQGASVPGVPVIRRARPDLPEVGAEHRMARNVLDRVRARRIGRYPDDFSRNLPASPNCTTSNSTSARTPDDSSAHPERVGGLGRRLHISRRRAAGQRRADPALPAGEGQQGKWRTVIEDMGMPAGKPKTIAVDLTGKWLSDSREVRIVTNLCVYWDESLPQRGHGRA